jgi:hypothetical protein
LKDKTGKIIKSVSLENKPELSENCNNQVNFSNYVQLLIEQDMERQKQVQQQSEEVITLTNEEKMTYEMCLRYFREFGSMKFGGYYCNFALQPEPDTLCCLILDVQDLLKKEPDLQQYVKSLRDDNTLYKAFYDRISKYWRQEHPIPENWSKEIVPGLTLHEALSKIIPKALLLKYDHNPMTIKRISEVLGLAYQQTYTQLMPHIRPILRELQVEVQ